jgi:hypothetical protein
VPEESVTEGFLQLFAGGHSRHPSTKKGLCQMSLLCFINNINYLWQFFVALEALFWWYLYPPPHVLMQTGTHMPITPFDAASEGTVRRETKISTMRFF